MTIALVGTDDGLWTVREEVSRPEFPGRKVTALSYDRYGSWCLLDGRSIARDEPDGYEELLDIEDFTGTCLAIADPTLLVGTAEAHLLRFVPHGSALELDTSFERAPGRDQWYTPWGGPPDVRSISRLRDGTNFVNVHVGGILRSSGDGWEPILDIDADVHEVRADRRFGLVLAATARGLAVSRDRGDTWEFRTEGLHAPYCRAVAITGITPQILVSASSGPFESDGAVYRTTVDGPLERCAEGLPEWFPGNVDTFFLSGWNRSAAIGSPDGRLFFSEDEGATWRLAAELPPIRCVMAVA